MKEKTEHYNKEYYNRQFEGSIRSATVFLEYLFKYYTPGSIVDFGCGVCSWLSVAEKLGVKKLVGLDGDWVESKQMQGEAIEFRITDFEKGVSLAEQFDLAMSVEVAEHFGGEYATSFVRSICRAAPVVVFGAAIPGQGGTQHVNEQPQSYWVDLFKKNNFKCFDFFRPNLWNNDEVETWYRQNTFLFVREDFIMKLPEIITAQPVLLADIVHPKTFKTKNKTLQDADVFRDAAIRIENENLELANTLMSIAKQRRPEGPFICQKLDEYAEKMSSES